MPNIAPELLDEQHALHVLTKRMHLVHHDPHSFRIATGTFLENAEAQHILMLGISQSLVDGGDATASKPLLITIEDDHVQLAAIRTAPFHLLLSHGSSKAVQTLCDALQKLGTRLPGVTGPVANATEFAELWTEHRELTMSQRIYRCDVVVPPTEPGGHVRPAIADDLEQLVRWTLEFNDEAHIQGTETDARKLVNGLIASGHMFVWENQGQLTSMAMARHPSAHGIRIGYVYTPPDCRRRGFASAVTAGTTQSMLDKGYAFCCLYADLSNPTSNELYQRIGYRPVSDNVMWSFLSET